eukprot:6177600-Pleurochrysis_carterae.AAC.4
MRLRYNGMCCLRRPAERRRVSSAAITASRFFVGRASASLTLDCARGLTCRHDQHGAVAVVLNKATSLRLKVRRGRGSSERARVTVCTGLFVRVCERLCVRAYAFASA